MRNLLVRGTILGLFFVPFAVFLFMVVWNANNPYCNGTGGGEDRIACALVLVWVPVFAILPGGLAGFLMGWLLGKLRSSRRDGAGFS